MTLDLLALLAILADVVTDSGGTWTGSAAQLQRAMLAIAGPDRLRHVPITTTRLIRHLADLAARDEDGLALHVDRISSHCWLLSADPVVAAR